MLLTVWLPIVVIGALHYTTSAHHHWAHDVLRRLYYLPIVMAAVSLGLRGGLATAGVVSVTYLPHAFLHPVHFDPGRGIDKALEIVLYFGVGTIAGYLAEAERRRRVELQQALDEQHRLTRQLVRAGKLSALGEVLAGMAHEIKNPLHTLLGTVEIVDPLIPKQADERRLWELHISELHRLGRVAERFLSFARPGPLEVRPVDLCEVARRLFDLVSSQARTKGIDLGLELPESPVVVEADHDQLTQIAMNIVLNGFTALEAKGSTIKISVIPATTGRSHLLRVENDGPPIPEEHLEHIFDPFYSGDDRGTGLGLSIAARIAEQHGGFIEAENGGLGVIFTVALPAPSASPRTREDIALKTIPQETGE